MTSKRYNSFSEIDEDLKILRLHQEINMESLKLNYQITKNALYPTRLLGGISGIIGKLTITLLAKKVIKKLS